MKNHLTVGRIFAYIFLCISFVVSVFPFYWMIVGMTNTSVDVIRGRMFFGGELLNNLRLLFTQFDMLQILINSSIISFFSVIGTLMVTSMAAYGFQMYKSALREKIYNLIMLAMMVPFAALMIPLFRLIVRMGLLNSLFGVIIISMASIFILFFFRQSFRAFPYEIIQAARIDGANEFRVFLSIFIPSMKSTYAAAAIYSFIASWNAYFWPLIILQTEETRTVTLAISAMSSSYTPQFGAMMAAIVIVTLPIIIVFFAFQRQFVQGMLGSVKQ